MARGMAELSLEDRVFSGLTQLAARGITATVPMLLQHKLIPLADAAAAAPLRQKWLQANQANVSTDVQEALLKTKTTLTGALPLVTAAPKAPETSQQELSPAPEPKARRASRRAAQPPATPPVPVRGGRAEPPAPVPGAFDAQPIDLSHPAFDALSQLTSPQVASGQAQEIARLQEQLAAVVRERDQLLETLRYEREIGQDLREAHRDLRELLRRQKA